MTIENKTSQSNPPIKSLSKQSIYLVSVVVLIIIIRFILINVIPLLDKTESRYSEIARLMVETQNWIVLQIDYGLDFWAKPPSSTWLSALGIKVFGLIEMAPRLPSFLICLGIIFLVAKYLVKERKSIILLAFILLTTPEFLIHVGVVSTDAMLMFSITLMMMSFWIAMSKPKRSLWSYLFYAAIGLGLLSKGPIILVLTIPPIILWLFIQKVSIRELFSKLPILIGSCITLIIALPWYYFAEKNSPGFIDYFIIGEHFKRFLVPGWEGDLYGSGHNKPLGSIWLFLILFAFPWVQVGFIKLWKVRKNILKNKWVSFLVFWMLWTPIFFTISKNILHTYVLPSMIPLALIIVHYWAELKSKRVIIILGSIFPVLLLISTSIFLIIPNKFEKDLNTDKYFISEITKKHKELDIYYWKLKTYSSQFYSEGKVKLVDSTRMDSILNLKDPFILMINNKHLKEIATYPIKKSEVNSNKKTSIFVVSKQ